MNYYRPQGDQIPHPEEFSTRTERPAGLCVYRTWRLVGRSPTFPDSLPSSLATLESHETPGLPAQHLGHVHTSLLDELGLSFVTCSCEHWSSSPGPLSSVEPTCGHLWPNNQSGHNRVSICAHICLSTRHWFLRHVPERWSLTCQAGAPLGGSFCASWRGFKKQT